MKNSEELLWQPMSKRPSYGRESLPPPLISQFWVPKLFGILAAGFVERKEAAFMRSDKTKTLPAVESWGSKRFYMQSSETRPEQKKRSWGQIKRTEVDGVSRRQHRTSYRR